MKRVGRIVAALPCFAARDSSPAPFGFAYKAKRRGLGPSAIFVSPPLQFKRNRRVKEAFYRQNRNLDVTVCSCIPH
ncbi:Hypothetical protein BN69_0268 [Methylocystis sp. SC2]|nr:Hypothetical protein BN69_0268 [Methylocystis sp. SC2]